MTTETQQEQTVEISYDIVQSFLRGTHDPNKELHKDWALGFQLELLLKAEADKVVHGENEKLSCTRMQSVFHQPVPVNSKIVIMPARRIRTHTHDTPERKYDAGVSIDMFVLVPAGEGKVEKERALRATFLYQENYKFTEHPYKGHDFVLNKWSAKRTAFGLKKEGCDYASLALGLVSNAMFQDSRDRKEKGQRIYAVHSLDVTRELDTLQNGETIRVLTGARMPEEIIDEKTKKITGYKVPVVATKKGGLLLYEGRLSVKFYDHATKTQ